MRRISIIAACILSSTAFAAPAPSIEEVDAALKEAKVVSTLPELRAMRDEMVEAFAAGECQRAIGLAQKFGPAANLTTLMAKVGTAPLGGGTSLDQSDHSIPFNTTRVDAVVHELTVGRVEGYVGMAECAVKLGQRQEAVAVFSFALRLIPATETALWERAANGLWGLLGIE